MFLGPDERLILSHRAESRAIFARGALAAARFLVGKPAGLYSMRDVIDAAVKKRRRFRILPPPGRGQSRARDRARIRQPLHAAGRGRAVGAGDRRRGQQGDAQPVRQGHDAAADARPRRGRACASTSRPSACSTPRPRTSSPPRGCWSTDHGGEVPRDRDAARNAPRGRAQDRQRRPQRRLRRADASRSTRTSSASPTAPAWRPARTPLEVELKLEKVTPAAVPASTPTTG